MSSKTKTGRNNSKAALKRQIAELEQEVKNSGQLNQELREELARVRGLNNQLQAELRGLNDISKRAERTEKEFETYRRDAVATFNTMKAESRGQQSAFTTALQIVSSTAASKNGHADNDDFPPGLELGGGSSHPIQALRSALLQAVAEARG